MVVYTLAKKWILVTSLVFSASTLANQTEEVDPYFQISEVNVTKIEAEPFNLEHQYSEPTGNRNVGEVIAMVDQLVALGTKVWGIIEKGKPTYNMALQNPINVIPKITDDNGIVTDSTFYSMYGWSAPTVATHRVEYKNGFGMVVASFDYQVHYQHGGSYDGKGSYVAGLTVTAKNINVRWGFNLDAAARLISITNRGTQDDPIAGATIEVRHKVHTITSAHETAESFHLTGTNELIHF
jgi:hypothetical protein